jgi:signal transduction histidine kinase
MAIGAGDLDQLIPPQADDDLGRLAGAFNTMARKLRGYRQSQHAQFHRAQQASQAAIDALPHPVLVVDTDGGVTMANPAAGRLFGVVPVAAHGGKPIPWQPPAMLGGPLADALQGQRPFLPQGFEQVLALRDGEQDRSFVPRILPIHSADGGALGAAVLLEEVTRYRVLDELKTNLVATASHELKTPLSTIRLVVHLLLEETVGPLTPKQLELLLDARANIERLLAMIERLLDLARLEHGQQYLDLRPEDPAELLQAAAETARPRAAGKGVEMVVSAASDLPRLAADAARLGHALNNLVDNALRYTPDGGRVTLSAAHEGSLVVLTVADTGTGIAPKHLPHVFEKFYRIPSQAGGGTGLGLALVREIVTAHGGTITCESRVGQGTTFRLHLPAWRGSPSRHDMALSRTTEPRT